MTVCVIGANGSMGRRYQAILKYLGVPFTTIDLGDNDFHDRFDSENFWSGFARAIIAAPTSTHYFWAFQCIKNKKPFLCEKPLSKKVDECEHLMQFAKESGVQAFVVNNYWYAFRETLGKHKDPFDWNITYNYYNTGKDGLWWDVCQLLYINEGAWVQTEAPSWWCTIKGTSVPYKWLEMSYVWMLQDWIGGETENLWTLEDGLKMTQAALKRIDRENCSSNTSKA